MLKKLFFVILLVSFSFSAAAQDSKIEADIGETVDIEVGDTITFGPENQNELSIEFIRDREGRNFHEMGIIPGIGSGTVTDDPLRIIFPDGRNHGGMTDTSFKTGNFDVEVDSHDISDQTATIRLVPRYSQSSNFDCENYDLSENQYAFCSNSDEEAERGAVQEIDLGHTTETINYVRNAEVTGDRYATTGVNHLFVNPDSGRTLQFWQQEESTYKGAGIEIVEWRGLSDEYNGRNMKVIIEVDPAAEPDASLDFGKKNYQTGEEINLDFEAFEPGKYNLEVSGAGNDVAKSYGESDNEKSIRLDSSREGEITAELTAPGSWWNPLDSDQTVAMATTEVKKPYSEVNHDFGEKFTISEGETTQIEGREFYMRTLVGSQSNGYPSILWRSSEEGTTNSPLVLLKRTESMGLQYDDSNFDPYGVVCEINPSSSSAEVVVKEERFNPWEACDRHPDELRSENDYEMKDYNLGERVSLEPGEGLKFGDSRAFLTSLDEYRDEFLPEGSAEWVNNNAGYWNPPFAEGSSTENYFYEGEILTGTCQINSEEIEIVMEKTSETNSEWPEAWCQDSDGNDRSENTRQSFNCETYNTASNEFKFCSPTTKNIEIEDTSYEAEFWFISKESGEPPTAEIDFKDSKSFTQIRPQGTSQVNGDAPAKNGYKLYLETHSGSDSQSPDDDSIVVEYTESEGTANSSEESTGNRESDTENRNEEGAEPSRISLGKEEITKEEELTVEGYVPESTAQAYEVLIKNPSGETLKQEQKTEAAFKTTYTPGESAETGEYKVQISPAGGLLRSIIGSLTGSETLTEKTFTVNNPDIPRWKQYCENQDYNTEDLQEQISCIKDQIVPKYFQDSIGDRPEIAESVCSNLLNRQYNQEEMRCD